MGVDMVYMYRVAHDGKEHLLRTTWVGYILRSRREDRTSAYRMYTTPPYGIRSTIRSYTHTIPA